MCVCVCVCVCDTFSHRIYFNFVKKSSRISDIYYKFFILFGNYRLPLLVDSLTLMRQQFHAPTRAVR